MVGSQEMLFEAEVVAVGQRGQRVAGELNEVVAYFADETQQDLLTRGCCWNEVRLWAGLSFGLTNVSNVSFPFFVVTVVASMMYFWHSCSISSSLRLPTTGTTHTL